MLHTLPSTFKVVIGFLCAILTTSLHTPALGQTLLKFGAVFDGCMEVCTAGTEEVTLQQCRSFCGCMVDEINEQGIAADYLPFKSKPPDFYEKNLQIQMLCADKVTSGSGQRAK